MLNCRHEKALDIFDQSLPPKNVFETGEKSVPLKCQLSEMTVLRPQTHQNERAKVHNHTKPD
jgi:hypothetical protein